MQGFLLAVSGLNGENIDIEHEFYLYQKEERHHISMMSFNFTTTTTLLLMNGLKIATDVLC